MPLINMTDGSVAWGDYDADGDLDLALSGSTADGPVSKIYRNNWAASNIAPAAPGGLTASNIGNVATFSWGPDSDNETASAGLSYNLRVGISPGGSDVFAGMADLSTGLRRIAFLMKTWATINYRSARKKSTDDEDDPFCLLGLPELELSPGGVVQVAGARYVMDRRRMSYTYHYYL